MAEDIVKPPANICVAIVDDKVSAHLLPAEGSSLGSSTLRVLWLLNLAASVKKTRRRPSEVLRVLTQASTKSLTDVVEEITLWTAGREGLPFKLHLLHVALLLPDRSEQAEEVKQQVRTESANPG